MRTQVEIKRYREARRRREAAAYARDRRDRLRETGAPDARAIGAALLSLALDEAVRLGRGVDAEQVVERLAEAGYDRAASVDVLRALRDRHAEALEIAREAEAA